MIKSISCAETKLIIDSDTTGHKEIDLGIKIWDLVHTGQLIVLLLDPKTLYNTEFHNRNIVCLNEQGDLLWRVENPDLLSISKEKTTYAFGNISLKEKDRIKVFRVNGYKVDVDINTGKFVSDWEFTK